jgi:hypothetical protein
MAKEDIAARYWYGEPGRAFLVPGASDSVVADHQLFRTNVNMYACRSYRTGPDALAVLVLRGA